MKKPEFPKFSSNHNLLFHTYYSYFDRVVFHMKNGMILMLALLLVACGDSDSKKLPPASTVSTGVFIDSPVEGLYYETATQSGFTNGLGEYDYLPGETVTYSVGGIILGSTLAEPVVTPLSLVSGEASANNLIVNNIVRFLLSLDSDGNSDNGISISNATIAAASNLTVDFSATDLSLDTGIDSLTTAVPAISLVNSTTAQNHLNNTLISLGVTRSNWGDMAWGSGFWKSKTQ